MLAKIRSSILVTSSALILFSGVPSLSAAPITAKPITIMLDGFPLPFPAAPFATKGTTMVPFRAIAEALNINVVWTEKTQSVTATKSTNGQQIKVILHRNDKHASVNGQDKLLTVAPVAKDGSIFVPLSFFSSQFGAAVSWNGAAQTVTITSPVEAMYTEAFYAISSFKELSYVKNFNSVSFGWTRIDDTGNLTLTGKDFYWPQAAGSTTPESIIQDASTAGSNPQLMAVATDGKGELTKLLLDTSLQKNVITQLVKLAVDNQFSGITLDFEGLGLTGDLSAIQQSYNEFVHQLAISAQASNLTLTLALHPLNGSYRGYDYKKLASYANEIIIMAYDYSYESGPEPLKQVDEAIQLALKTVPKNKLVLGISMGSENSQSINSKIGLAKRYSLKGIAIWRLGLISTEVMNQIQKTITMKA
ncbi:hypothetical protein Back11_07080 [Paenibacillus baekrokdamisoli]|uniref:Uncharacterized protein n=1 Tax=Paenibacillus baekrokdamisoli TaxID=1712516 RepID=A0A3G9J3S5_9BACL|nr:stalk domain-containing protein [Paenibacillus baekrokdamisoli]MBB3067450.1 spore germination protein YaaH [Paenibacillus baekrokdamisoli]BBH19363.1 hypothetical protein Back11_07080 [Paenibacillus baekrokdamisoli]